MSMITFEIVLLKQFLLKQSQELLICVAIETLPTTLSLFVLAGHVICFIQSYV